MTEYDKKRFWKYVIKTDGCWKWTGCLHQQGYGRLLYNGKVQTAHRWSWRIHFGEIPENMCVLHRCDNTECTNPRHLFLGTQQENVIDMITKKRRMFKGVKGANHYLSKLNTAAVKSIRFLSATTDLKYADFAQMYQVSGATVRDSIMGKTWGHI